MKLLITGASGFLGKNFLLRNKGDEIFAFYNSSKEFPQFLEKNSLKNVAAIKCDLSDFESVKKAFSQLPKVFDACLYLAANSDPRKSFDDPLFDLKNSVQALLNFLQFYRGKKIVFLSSGSVYDGLKGSVSPASNLSPTLPYAINKLACEHYVKFYCEQKKTISSFVVIRFFGAFGPCEPERKVYSKLVKAFAIEKRNSFEIYGDGKNLIDAMYVDDAVEALDAAVRRDVGSVVVDLPGGNQMTIAELVQLAAKAFGVKNVKIVSRGVSVEPIHFTASGKPFEKLFGVAPKTPLEEGLRKLEKFLVKNK